MFRKIFTIIVLCISVSLFGQNEQEVIKLDSHIYPLYFSILRESGVVSPSRSLPMTRAQIYKVLDSIDFDSLSETGKKAYNTIYNVEKSKLHIANDDMVFTLDASSALEVTVPNDSGITPLRDFNQRLPLLSIPTSLGVKNILYFYSDLSIQEEVYGSIGDKGAFRWFNIPGDITYLDGQAPLRVYGSIGKDFWNISLGRDRLETGVGEKSHLIIGSEPQYLENLRAKLFWNGFNYEFQLLTMLPIATHEEFWGEPRTFHNPEQWFLNHRFDFRFFKGKLRFTWNEATILAGQPLEPKFFNPFMIFHSFYNWYEFMTPWEGIASAISGFELSYTPIPQLEIYGHSVITQFTVPFLETVTDEPTANGFKLGAVYDFILSTGYLTTGAEWTMASPWLYVRDSSWDSYIWGRNAPSKINEVHFKRSPYTLITRPLGYKWGNDAMGLHTWANYNSSSGKYSAKLEYEIAALGENDFESAWKEDSPPQKGAEAVALRAPSGTPEYHNVITLSNKWNIKEWLILDCGMHTRFINNLNHVPNSNTVLFEPWVGVAVKFTSF